MNHNFGTPQAQPDNDARRCGDNTDDATKAGSTPRRQEGSPPSAGIVWCQPTTSGLLGTPSPTAGSAGHHGSAPVATGCFCCLDTTGPAGKDADASRAAGASVDAPAACRCRPRGAVRGASPPCVAHTRSHHEPANTTACGEDNAKPVAPRTTPARRAQVSDGNSLGHLRATADTFAPSAPVTAAGVWCRDTDGGHSPPLRTLANPHPIFLHPCGSSVPPP